MCSQFDCSKAIHVLSGPADAHVDETDLWSGLLEDWGWLKVQRARTTRWLREHGSRGTVLEDHDRERVERWAFEGLEAVRRALEREDFSDCEANI